MRDIKNILGIEIGGTKIQLLLQNRAGKNLLRERFTVDAKAGANGILYQIEKGVETILLKEEIDAVGVGFGGPIDRDSGIIRQSSHVTGWDGFSLTDWVKGIVSGPVFAENDANVAALGEALQGAGKGFESLFYVTIGSGIGGGLVRNGFIAYGKKPGESEIGLIHIDFQGNRLQDYASGWGINGRIRRDMDNYPDSPLTVLSKKHTGNEARHLGPALLQEDFFAQRIFKDTVKCLGLAFSHVIHLIHPGALVIGGGVSQLGEPFRKAVEEELSQFVTSAFHPLPPVLLSGLGEDVVPVGAIELVKQKIR